MSKTHYLQVIPFDTDPVIAVSSSFNIACCGFYGPQCTSHIQQIIKLYNLSAQTISPVMSLKKWSIDRVTMASSLSTTYVQCCRRHFVGIDCAMSM